MIALHCCLPFNLASDKDLYVKPKYSKHSSPTAQEKTLTATRCTQGQVDLCRHSLSRLYLKHDEIDMMDDEIKWAVIPEAVKFQVDAFSVFMFYVFRNEQRSVKTKTRTKKKDKKLTTALQAQQV